MSSNIYTLIKIKGNGIIITEIDRHEANDIIEDNNLKVHRFRKEGIVYSDNLFKEYVNNNLELKNQLINIIKKLDE